MDRWLNKIILGDCLDVMREMPDKCVDLVLTDPPYGIKVGGAKPFGKVGRAKPFGKVDGGNPLGRETTGKVKGAIAPTEFLLFDDSKTPSQEIFDEMMRVSKNQIIFGGNYFQLPPSPCWLVWDKQTTGNFADCELAWTSFKTAVRKFKYTWNGLLQEDMKNKEQRIHPTQKPITLFEWILKLYSKPGDIILDPFLGSGTTVAACINLERKYIGIEISPDYVLASQKRIEKATAQKRMFV